MIEKPSNWAGNYTYRAARFHKPETVEQLHELVRRSSKLKPLGTRHSFNDIADSPGDLISLEHFNQITGLDLEHRTVTVEAGVRYGQLARWLHEEGYALHNMASLPHISVAGACATGTHGSGDQNGNLSTAVSALEMVTADGDLIALSAENCTEQMGIRGPWHERLPHFRMDFTPSSGEELAPFNARPHWAKLFMMSAARIESLYEQLPDFRQLLIHYDPQGKFRNAFLDRYIFGSS